MVHHDRDRGVDDDRVVHRTERRDSESIVRTRVRTLSVVEDTPAAELDPLYGRIEPEALDSLLAHARRTDTATAVEVAAGEYTVVVVNDAVRVHDGCPAVATCGCN